MIKQLLAGSSVFTLLLGGNLSAQAEAPKPEPQFQAPETSLPPVAKSNVLSKYFATDTVPVLKRGSSGQAVKDVQQFLKQTGLYTGPVDGVFGSESEDAVAQFQELVSLTPDGIVGTETWRAMIYS